MNTIDRVAIAISNAPFPSAKARAQARRAIAALREASPLMVEKGADELKVYCDDAKDYADGVEQACDVWSAMVDAALSETSA